jgi:hypothetical protein
VVQAGEDYPAALLEEAPGGSGADAAAAAAHQDALAAQTAHGSPSADRLFEIRNARRDFVRR